MLRIERRTNSMGHRDMEYSSSKSNLYSKEVDIPHFIFNKFSKHVVERKALHVSTIYNIYTGRDRSLEVESSYTKLNILRNCSLESEALLFLVNAEIFEEHLPLEVPPVALARRFTS